MAKKRKQITDLDIEKLQGAFTIVNARIGIHGPGDTWGLELWAQNLFDKTYTQVAFDMPLQGYGTGVFSNTMRGGVEPHGTMRRRYEPMPKSGLKKIVRKQLSHPFQTLDRFRNGFAGKSIHQIGMD